MKLYIDDIREAPEGWTLARTINEAINIISMYGQEITDISLDHDISHQVKVGEVSRPYPCNETFKAVAHYIVTFWTLEFYRDKTIKFPNITLHTANPVGAERMEAILEDFEVEIKLSKPANRLEA